ncbi:MAG TPA: thiamine phosphate synthase, partial [Candidatus Binataceae bacterium]|nr:thiamine phosphate synthase [Candidatus Binataceae bacterium]
MESARRPPDLYLITDRKLIGARTLPEICAAILRAASDAAPEIRVALQLREKDLSGRALFELASALRPICTRNHAALLINDRIDVALAVDADGVHLPGNSFEIADVRRMLGAQRLIGISTHSAGEVERAAQAGADFAVFGPVYEALSKRGYGAGRGGEEL